MSEYDRLKVQKDAILAKEREQMRKELIADPAPSQPAKGICLRHGPYEGKCTWCPAPCKDSTRLMVSIMVGPAGDSVWSDFTRISGDGADPAVPQATAPEQGIGQTAQRYGAQVTEPAARLSDAEIARKHFPDGLAHPNLLNGVRAKCEAALAERGRQDAEQWAAWGVVEIAIRNKQVAEYCAHWEARTTAAESRVTALTAKVEELETGNCSHSCAMPASRS